MDRRHAPPPANAPGPRARLPVGGLLALASLIVLGGCNRHPGSPAAPGGAPAPAPPASALDPGQADPVGDVSGLEAYLASPAAPSATRTFGFAHVEFAIGRSELSPAGLAELAAVARVLNRPGNAGVRVQVTTHANMRGDLAAALALAQARADAIKAALVGQGVAAGRIQAVPGGVDSLDGVGPTAPGLARNRRAELTVLRQ